MPIRAAGVWLPCSSAAERLPVADERPAPPPGRDLPAPYQDPWQLLGRDLRAVLASSRLRVWELARRNRQGDLEVPGFWPRDLTPWFWPLLLGLALAAVVALILLVPPLVPERAAPSAPPPTSPVAPVLPDRESGSDPLAISTPATAEPGDRPPAAGPGPEPEPAATPAEPLAPPVPVLDPLLALLEPADPRRLIRALDAVPDRSCLELQLDGGFTALAPQAQEQQAEAWRVRALELGYERLELVDGSGRLLGRTARVGSGMILLTSAATPADAP